jgi:GGDEF domain-containing protein
MKRILAQASRTLNPLSLLIIDLDHFKSINDRFGHPVGDQVLPNVGAALYVAKRRGRNRAEVAGPTAETSDVLSLMDEPLPLDS